MVTRRRRWKTVCARGADRALLRGPSTSPLACRDVPCYILAMRHISVADVVALPVAERLRLVEAIWDSIAEVPEQLELSPAQSLERSVTRLCGGAAGAGRDCAPASPVERLRTAAQLHR